METILDDKFIHKHAIMSDGAGRDRSIGMLPEFHQIQHFPLQYKDLCLIRGCHGGGVNLPSGNEEL